MCMYAAVGISAMLDEVGQRRKISQLHSRARVQEREYLRGHGTGYERVFNAPWEVRCLE
jgi:hypothetical protein